MKMTISKGWSPTKRNLNIVSAKRQIMRPVVAARMTKLTGLQGLETPLAIIVGVVVEVEAGPQVAPLVVAAVVPH